MLLKTRIQEVLADLGGDSEEVAASLRSEGVKGQLFSPDSCPVSEYLAKKFPEYHVSTGVGSTLLSRRVKKKDDYTAVAVSCSLPSAVKSFIENFDGRQYEDLAYNP